MDGKKIIVLAVILVLSLGAYVTEATAQPTVLTMCGSVGTGSYVLGNNISTAVTCFTLTGNDITIDLNGFTIDGDDGPDLGITDGGSSRQNIVIRNGTIRDFANGIDLFASDGCKVEWILAFSNGFGIVVDDNCHVSHNIANSNSALGIFTNGNSNISYNIANNNGNDGIKANNGGSNILYNNANGNTDFGINVICPSNLVGNTAQNNGVANLNQQGPGCKRYNNLF